MRSNSVFTQLSWMQSNNPSARISLILWPHRVRSLFSMNIKIKSGMGVFGLIYFLFFLGVDFLVISPAVYAKSPRLGVCSRGILSALGASYPGLEHSLNDETGKPLLGFESARYQEDKPLRVSVVLRTDNEVYYYLEPCDICASLWVCQYISEGWSLGHTTEFKNAHALGCEDLPQIEKSKIRYSACQ